MRLFRFLAVPNSRGWLFAWAAVAPIAVLRAGTFAESDTFWAIRTGEVILDTGRVPTTDPFSWTAAGQPWHPNSWAFDVLLAVAYRCAGFTGVAALCILLVMAVQASLLLLAAVWGARPGAAGPTGLVFLGVCLGWLSARPQLVDYIALPLAIVLTTRAFESRGRRSRGGWLVAIAALHCCWVNAHSAAALGIAVVALVGAGRMLTGWLGHRAGSHAEPQLAEGAVTEAGGAVAGPSRLAEGSLAVVATLAAVVGTMASPLGIGLFEQATKVRQASVGIVLEWGPITQGDVTGWVLLAIAGLAAVPAMRRLQFDRAATLVFLAVGGVLTLRLLPMAALVAAAALAANLDWGWLLRYTRSRARMLRFGAALTAGALCVPAAVSATHLGRTMTSRASLGTLPAGCRLINEYQLGGLVILLRPDVPVGIDSRNDIYGRAQVLRLQRLVTEPEDGPAALANLGVTCAYLSRGSALARQLAGAKGWREASPGSNPTVYLRD